MKAATFSASGAERSSETRLWRQLRAAFISENEAHLQRLIGDLLSAQGPATGTSISQRARVVLDVLHSLRPWALNDDVTGLYTRRGFIQIASRALHVARLDDRPAHLIYFELEDFAPLRGNVALAAAERAAWRMSQFMRELCPDYASYDVLGRLSIREFAALTMSADPEIASRKAIWRRARGRPDGDCPCEQSLQIGVARFDPQQPVAIEGLLDRARRSGIERGTEQEERARNDSSPGHDS